MKLQFAIAIGLFALAGSAGASGTDAGPQSAPSGTAGIELRMTLAPWTTGPRPCGETSVLDIAAGTRVAVCYTVTNRSGRALDWHYLRDSYFGDASFYDALLHEPLADGASLSFTNSTPQIWSDATLRGTWMSQDAAPPDYTFDDTVAFAYVDLGASPTAQRVLHADGDGATGGLAATVEMPFAFRFYEKPAVTQLCIGLRGAIFVDQPDCDPFMSDGNFGEMPVGYKQHLIAPAWTNYNSGLTGGSVYVDTQGVAPNRRFIVEWQGMTRNYVPGPGITFEAIIDEGSGAITFQYRSMTFDDGTDGNGAGGDDGSSATAGIQRSYGAGGDAPVYTQYSWWTPVLTSGKAIRWTAAPLPYHATASDAARITVVAPQIAVGPAAIDVAVPSHGSTTTLLTVANRGNLDLNWSLDGIPARTGFQFDAPYATTTRAPARDRADAARRRAAAANRAAQPVAPVRRSESAVPAYAIAFYGSTRSDYASLDATVPGTLARVNGDVFGYPVQVGGFVDNDFSRQYLLQNGGCDSNLCWSFEFQYLLTRGGGGTSGSIGTLTAPYAAAGAVWHGAKWDATTHTLYAVSSTADAPARTDLYTIDPRLGTPMWIARVDDVSDSGTKLLDIAVAPNGDLYGIDEYTDTLIAIDKRNGHIRPIGPTGLDAGDYDVQSMDFDPSTGILYYAAYPLTPTVTGMYTVDLASGAATLIAPIGDGATALTALAIAVPGGPCLNPQDVPWLATDPGRGVTAANGFAAIDVTFDGSSLPDGVYKTKICIESDTPFKHVVAVPVTLTVGTPDTIFGSGFEPN